MDEEEWFKWMEWYANYKQAYFLKSIEFMRTELCKRFPDTSMLNAMCTEMVELHTIPF